METLANVYRLFCPQCLGRINEAGAGGWENASQQTSEGKEQSSCGKQERILRRHFVELRRQKMAKRE
jgi:hypothetical protein